MHILLLLLLLIHKIQVYLVAYIYIYIYISRIGEKKNYNNVNEKKAKSSFQFD
jgi:hypothetical protein